MSCRYQAGGAAIRKCLSPHKTVHCSSSPDNSLCNRLIAPENPSASGADWNMALVPLPQLVALNPHILQDKTITGIVCRAYATDVAGNGINRNLTARDLNETPSLLNAIGHLNGTHLPTPWISLFQKWRSVLDLIQRHFVQFNAARIHVHFIDMDLCDLLSGPTFAQPISTRTALSLRNEVLAYRNIPQAAVLSTMVVTNHQMNQIPIHLGHITLPTELGPMIQHFIHLAATGQGHAAMHAPLHNVWLRRGVDHVGMLRLVQWLCTLRHDL